MIERDNFPQEEGEVPGQEDQSLNDINPQSLEEQEQLNSDNLVQRIEEEDTPSDDYGDADETTDEASRGEEDLSNFTGRELPLAEGSEPIGSEKPVSRNQLGDNPPGSEQKAFEAGNSEDMNSDISRYQDKDIKENFRENLDKSADQINLDKKLKEGQ